MRRHRRNRSVTSVVRLLAGCVAVVGLSACGGDDAMTEDAPGDISMAGAPATGDEPQALNGCGASDFEDRSGDEDERIVQIAVEGLKFTPPCITIGVGQSVSFEGSLSAHPLAPGNADDEAAGSLNNPISKTSSGDNVAFTFDEAGTFPYYCELHSFGAGMGMAGAVYVR